LRGLVMSAITATRDRRAWSGGKGRVCGPAADDPDGAQELDPVGVDVGFGGGVAAAQDVQHQARHSVIRVATLRRRRHFVARTGCRFFPEPRKPPSGCQRNHHPQAGYACLEEKVVTPGRLPHPERGAGG